MAEHRPRRLPGLSRGLPRRGLPLPGAVALPREEGAHLPGTVALDDVPARAEELARVYTRKPRPPFTVIERSDGSKEKLWCTFDYEQIDLDWWSAKTREVMRRQLIQLARRNVDVIRLDAVGYIIAAAPHQTPDASLEDLLVLARRRVLAGLSIFYPAPGSPDFDLCRRLDLLPGFLGRLRSSALPIEHSTRRIDSATLLRLGRILNFMKHLLDRGLPLPAPRPPDADVLAPGDRIDTGRRLLSWFLADGCIRGLTPDGVVYDHRSDRRLCDRFLNGLRKITLRGTV